MVYNVRAIKTNKEKPKMKFKKLTLDESLFDDDMSWDTPLDIEGESVSDFDDDFTDSDHIPSGLETPQGPRAGESTGIADTIISLINDEWEAIQGYNNFMDMLRGVMANTDVQNIDKMLPVISDIVNEENKHVGQLQELLKIISPNANSIEQGAHEGATQIANSAHEWVNGKLKVEMHPEVRSTESHPTNEVDTTCTIYNVDDEF